MKFKVNMNRPYNLIVDTLNTLLNPVNRKNLGYGSLNKPV